MPIRANHLGPAAGISLGALLNTNPKLERLRVQLSSDEHAVPIMEALQSPTTRIGVTQIGGQYRYARTGVG